MVESEHKQTLTIAELKRLRSSTNGNPRFAVTFTNGQTAETGKDSQVAYKIENSEYQDVPVVVTFTPAGRIVNVQVAEDA